MPLKNQGVIQTKGNKGRWYFVEHPNQSDKKIYFANYPNQSGWRNKSKQHLLY